MLEMTITVFIVFSVPVYMFFNPFCATHNPFFNWYNPYGWWGLCNPFLERGKTGYHGR